MRIRELGLAAILLSGCAEVQKPKQETLEARMNYYEEACICKKEAMKPENEQRKNDILTEAFNYFEMAKREPDRKAISTLQQADVLSLMGDWEEAMKYADEAVKIKPCVEMYNGRGHLAIRQQEFSAAIDSFTLAIKMNDNEASRWGRFDAYLLGGTFEGNKEYLKKAVKDARKCQKFAPELPDCYVAEAAARLSMQEPEEVSKAYDLFKTAIRLLDEGKKFKRYEENSVREIWNKLNTNDKAQ